MILSWKNILWFQRVSEHVLELGHYEIKESKVCITHSDCVKKKKTYSIHFIIPMLMKVYLYCLFPPIDWFTRSLDAEFIDVTSCFVFAKRKKGGGEGGCFCDSFEVIPQWRCVMYIQKSQHISPQFDQLSLSTVFLCSLSISSVLELQARLFDWNSDGQPGQKTFTLKLGQHHHTNAPNPKDQKHQPSQEWCNDSRGETVCDK